MSTPEPKSELIAKAAWLYYVGNYTQQQIAEELEVSRPTVNRLVALASETGLVQVRINHPIRECMEAAAALRKRFDLGLCEVCPADSHSADGTAARIAMTGAAVIERYLSRSDMTVLALGAGKTLTAVVEQISPTPLPNLKILSLAGCVAIDGSFNRFDVGLRMADKTGGKHFLQPMPLAARSVEEKEIWKGTGLNEIANQLHAKATTAFIGVGEMQAKCPLVDYGFMTPEEASELAGQGAVAEILGWPIDRNGKLVKSGWTDRVTSIELERLASRPMIAIAGGPGKQNGVLAALKGRWIAGLVTDLNTAHELLQH